MIISKEFDLAVFPETPKKRYISPMNHPWGQAAFEKYMKKQFHKNKIA